MLFKLRQLEACTVVVEGQRIVAVEGQCIVAVEGQCIVVVEICIVAVEVCIVVGTGRHIAEPFQD